VVTPVERAAQRLGFNRRPTPAPPPSRPPQTPGPHPE
jgi:hypothetical protein